MIYGNSYVVIPPKRCIELLEKCLKSSVGRSSWLSNLIPYEYVCSGHLARVKLATYPENESVLKEVIKLSEQSGLIWLECLSNFHLGKLLSKDSSRHTEAMMRLE